MRAPDEDYWGTYTYDPVSGQLTMNITGRNYIPEKIDLEGTVSVQPDGTIRLDSMYFGPPRHLEGDSQVTCGYILE